MLLSDKDRAVGAVEENRHAWDVASQKYSDEAESFVRDAREGTLAPVEQTTLERLVESRSVVVHLQSGNGTDDAAIAGLGASTVIGVDFSRTAATATQRRAVRLNLPATYVVGDVLHVPLAASCADVVYTGKGALMWLPDLTAWGSEVARLLRTGGHLFVYEAHPAAALWTCDPDHAALVAGRSYFGGTRINDTFPASAIERFSSGQPPKAVEWQWTIADVVSAVLSAGLRLEHLGEYPEPFWQPGDSSIAAAWTGHLPNSFSLLAATTR
jgi:SAM-dependent methyltransferase